MIESELILTIFIWNIILTVLFLVEKHRTDDLESHYFNFIRRVTQPDDTTLDDLK